MKKVYIKPAMHVQKIALSRIICVSVIQPGKPNTPAGSRYRRDMWDDEEFEND